MKQYSLRRSWIYEAITC